MAQPIETRDSVSTSDNQNQLAPSALHSAVYDPTSKTAFVPTTYDTSADYLPNFGLTGNGNANASSMASVFKTQDQVLAADPSLASNQAVMNLFAAQDRDMMQANANQPAESNTGATGTPTESGTATGTATPSESGTGTATGTPTESGSGTGTGTPSESGTQNGSHGEHGSHGHHGDHGDHGKHAEPGSQSESGTPASTGTPAESGTPAGTGTPMESNPSSTPVESTTPTSTGSQSTPTDSTSTTGTSSSPTKTSSSPSSTSSTSSNTSSTSSTSQPTSGSTSSTSSTTSTTGDNTGSSTTPSGATGAPSTTSGSASLTAMENSDPALATTLKAASTKLTTEGYGQLQSYLEKSNPTANTNLDATTMSNALTQAGLSSADSTALQSLEIADMPAAQVMTYMHQNDSALDKTVTDASTQLSSAGNSQLQNYLVNNYTADNYMDGTLMNNVLNQSGLSTADQAALTGVLQKDMPTALDSDPFAAGLQASDPTMSKTLTDASSALSKSGYSSLETYVEDNYTGDTSSDNTIMNGALTQASLSSADSAALNKTLQQDMPDAVSGSSTTPSGSDGTGTTGTSGSGTTGGETGTTTTKTGSGSDTTGSSGSGTTDTGSSGSTSTSTTGSGSGTTGYANDGGNAGSTTTFGSGNGTLLEPPQSNTGLVTPAGSTSGDSTAYQGTIQGTTSGANKITPDSETTGQGNGPDTMQLNPVVTMTSMDTSNGAGFQQKYGYFEADIKVEGGANGWPGWFLESSAHTLNPTTDPSAEIDIMEAQTSSTNGKGDTAYNAGVHLNSSNYAGGPADQDQGPYVTGLNNISTGYNTYGVLWQPNDKNIEFYDDGKEVGYNPVYDTTDSSPMYMVLDNISGGWSTSDPSATAGPLDVAWTRAYQESSLLNSANDPNGTEGTTITDTNPNDSPPAISGETWVNTFNTDFTQPSDYTTSSGYTSANVPNSQNVSEINSSGTGAHSASTPDPDNTPWYEGQWVVDQQTSIQGVPANMSTTPA